MNTPADYKFHHADHVRWGDMDALGHVNNNAIGVYFESARVAMLDALGLGVSDDSDRPANVVIAKITIEFKAELHYPNAITVGLGIRRIGGASMTIEGALFAGERLIATHQAVIVLIDSATRKPTPLPDRWRDAMAPHLLPEAAS